MSKISVILPAYNAEATIRATIEAVLAQDLQDIDLIVTDDGSTDGTFEVCRELLSNDMRMHLVMRGHGGVSSARNAGLRYATGEFVAFADADDVPSPHWLSSLLALIGNADLAVCGYEVVGEDGAALYDTLQRVPAERFEVSSDAFTCDLFSNRLMYQGYVWNKLFRTDVIRSNELRFRKGIAYNEDRLFVYDYLKRCKTVAVSGRPCYAYHAKLDERPYSSSQATELAAFDEMTSDLMLRIRRGEDLTEAANCLAKDTFRAAVDLFAAAHAADDPDALWLADCVRDLSRFRNAFSDYPASWQEKLQRVLSEI